MDDKEFYLDAMKGIVPEQKEVQLQNVFYSFLEIEHLYDSAINVVKTQLNILNNEFNMRFQRNPIHSIESRIKTPQSIIGKLQRKGFAVSPESAREHLQDIAGVRVICCYIDDIYALADLLTVHKDFTSTGKQIAPVEIQIRTIAMDFWASLEHQLHYKSIGNATASSSLTGELKHCAETIASIDLKMQEMFNQINNL